MHSDLFGVNVLFIFFWLVIVLAGILCAANRYDLTAGYNALVTGHT